jgi:putative membrane protein
MEVVGQLLADADGWGHMSEWGWGWMIFGSLFWAAAMGLVVWAVVRNPGAAPPKADPEAILAERFALGEISADEFTERRAALRQ